MWKYIIKVSLSALFYLFFGFLLVDSLRFWNEPEWFFSAETRENWGRQDANWQVRSSGQLPEITITEAAAVTESNFVGGGEEALYFSKDTGFTWEKSLLIFETKKSSAS